MNTLTEEIYQQLCQKAWDNPIFKQQLLENPKAILAEAGITIPEELDLKAVEETDFNRYILLSDESEVLEGGEEEDPLANLKAKAAQDDAFKAELVSQPKSVIEKELGLHLPSWMEVDVLEETPTQSFLIIPYLPSEEEVSKDEMMAIAGGFRFRRFIRRVGRAIKRVIEHLPPININFEY
jgi:hypothetical protein